MAKKMEKLAVIGNPVLRSRSPRLFARLFETAGIRGAYSRIAADNTEEAIWFARELGLRGMNITMPFKQAMVAKTAASDPRVRGLGCLNTMVSVPSGWQGFNSDPEGVLQPLVERRINLKEQRVLVLGAGGAAAAAVAALGYRCRGLTLLNRSVPRAEGLARYGRKIRVARPQNLRREIGDHTLVINTLPIPVIPPENNGAVFVEAAYPQPPERRLKIQKKGYTYIPGEEWLFHQGVSSFTRFFPKVDTAIPPAEDSLPILRNPERRRHLALIGFMGTGKTTLGRMLAGELGWDFLDTDQMVERQVGRPVAETIRIRGEAVFRNRENGLWRNLTALSRPTVLATGGGFILNSQNRCLLKRHFRVIWPYTPLEQCLERCRGNTRPLLSGRAFPAAKGFRRRMDGYFETADLIIGNWGSPGRTVRRIKNELHPN